MSANQIPKPVVIPQPNGNVLMKLSDFLALSKVSKLPIKITKQTITPTEGTKPTSQVLQNHPVLTEKQSQPVLTENQSQPGLIGNKVDEKIPEGKPVGEKKKNVRGKRNKCPVCRECCSSLLNLRRHIAEAHSTSENNPGKKADSEKKTVSKKKTVSEKKQNFDEKKKNTDGKKYICAECKNSFSNIVNLQRHMARHKNGASKPLKEKKPKPFKCDICNKSFCAMTNMRFHQKKFHNTLTFRDFHKCPLCSEDCLRKTFSKHLEESHNIRTKTRQLQFKSFEEFSAWKKIVEKGTKAYFKRIGVRRIHTNNTVYNLFSCHRSGTFKQSGQNKRKLKIKGTVRIGATCPAFMKVVLHKDKHCKVTFQCKHVGHDHDLKHQPLTFEERQFVASKLSYGLPLTEILDDIKKSAYSTERMQILTRKDLHNIKNRFFKNISDPDSFLSWDGIFRRLQDICNKHVQSMFMRAEAIKLENSWMVRCAEDGGTFFVKENQVACTCQLSCVQCLSCAHLFSCSCPDSSVDKNMCKHIHLVCSQKNWETVNVYLTDNDGETQDSVPDDVQDVGFPHASDDSSSNTCDASNVLDNTHPPSPLIPVETRNALKKKYVDLIDSVTSLEEIKLLEHTLLLLTPKQTNP